VAPRLHPGGAPGGQARAETAWNTNQVEQAVLAGGLRAAGVGKKSPARKNTTAPARKRPGTVARAPSPKPAPMVDMPRVSGGSQQAIVSTVTGMGYELVDVERAARGLLRVTIDRIPGNTYTHGGVADSGEFITVDDCEAVTRQLQYALEVEGLEYARLEVSSPGLDRPLKTEADYQRFAGLAVDVTLKAPFEGRKRFQGTLQAGEAAESWNLIFLNGKTEQVLGFTLAEVREARLVPVVDFKGRKSKDSGVQQGE
jgi:ribosome maturation factor RimP